MSPRENPQRRDRLAAGYGTHGHTCTGAVRAYRPGRFEVWLWGQAPAGLMTRRQLAHLGLRPCSPDPVGAIAWRRGTAHAWLYDTATATPKQPPSEGQRRGLAAAMRTRRTCTHCHQLSPYCLPISNGRRCFRCAEGVN